MFLIDGCIHDKRQGIIQAGTKHFLEHNDGKQIYCFGNNYKNMKEAMRGHFLKMTFSTYTRCCSFCWFLFFFGGGDGR